MLSFINFFFIIIAIFKTISAIDEEVSGLNAHGPQYHLFGDSF